MTDKRILRCLKILTFLSTDTPVTASAIADELGVSDRTIRNDIKILRRVPFPIKSCGSGYVIDKSKYVYLHTLLGMA